MDIISFDKLLLKTAFCCMASDGHIDDRELISIKKLCKESLVFNDFNFHEEINHLVELINVQGKDFIKSYFKSLDEAQLTEDEELALIDFAITTINADEQVEYSEIKFFKNIRHRLKINDEKILERFPDIESYLEADIITETYLDKLMSNYLDLADLPQFTINQIADLNTDHS